MHGFLNSSPALFIVADDERISFPAISSFNDDDSLFVYSLNSLFLKSKWRYFKENVFPSIIDRLDVDFIKTIDLLIDSNKPQERSVALALIVSLEIVFCVHKNADRSIFVIGAGFFGGQIAHYVSHFIVDLKRFVEFLPLLFLIAGPLLQKLPEAVKSLLLVSTTAFKEAFTDFASWKDSLALECSNKIGFDPELLDQTRLFIQSVVSKFAIYNYPEIQAMATIGTSFSRHSLFPNLWAVKKYYNFYSLSDREVFEEPRIDLEGFFQPGSIFDYFRAKNQHKPMAQVFNVEVFAKDTSAICSDSSKVALSHKNLLSAVGAWLPFYFLVKDMSPAFPCEAKLVLEPNHLVEPLVSEANPNSPKFKFRKKTHLFIHWIKNGLKR